MVPKIEGGTTLRVFENWVVRRIFVPKRDEVTGEWRKLHNEELLVRVTLGEGGEVKSRYVNKHGSGVNDLWTRCCVTCKQRWLTTLPPAVT